jgi:hypothetical protein
MSESTTTDASRGVAERSRPAPAMPEEDDNREASREELPENPALDEDWGRKIGESVRAALEPEVARLRQELTRARKSNEDLSKLYALALERSARLERERPQNLDRVREVAIEHVRRGLAQYLEEGRTVS